MLVYESQDISVTLQDLVPFVQLKKREKNHWRIVTYSEVAELLAWNFTKSSTPPWVFFTFFELCKWYQIVENNTFSNKSRFKSLLDFFAFPKLNIKIMIAWL